MRPTGTSSPYGNSTAELNPTKKRSRVDMQKKTNQTRECPHETNDVVMKALRIVVEQIEPPKPLVVCMIEAIADGVSVVLDAVGRLVASLRNK